MTAKTPIVIGIASGRPGAGRRTLGISLAAALAATDRRVGLTGTEALGPIVPETLGAAEPRWRDGRLVPRERFGVQVMSFAFPVEEDERMDGRLPSLVELATRFESLVGGCDPGDLRTAEAGWRGDRRLATGGAGGGDGSCRGPFPGDRRAGAGAHREPELPPVPPARAARCCGSLRRGIERGTAVGCSLPRGAADLDRAPGLHGGDLPGRCLHAEAAGGGFVRERGPRVAGRAGGR